MLIRRIARPMLSAVFIARGVDALRSPKPAADAARPTLEGLSKLPDPVGTNVPSNAETVARINAAVADRRRPAARHRQAAAVGFGGSRAQRGAGQPWRTYVLERNRPAAQGRRTPRVPHRHQPHRRVDHRRGGHRGQTLTGLARPPRGPQVSEAVTAALPAGAATGGRSPTAACRKGRSRAAGRRRTRTRTRPRCARARRRTGRRGPRTRPGTGPRSRASAVPNWPKLPANAARAGRTRPASAAPSWPRPPAIAARNWPIPRGRETQNSGPPAFVITTRQSLLSADSAVTLDCTHAVRLVHLPASTGSEESARLMTAGDFDPQPGQYGEPGAYPPPPAAKNPAAWSCGSSLG